MNPSSALAWHDDGHRIVAEIASRHLSKSALEQINALLADMPDYSTMATAATWADQQAKLDPAFAFAYSSHYINVEQRATPREVLATCLEKSGCVVTGIAYYVDVLRSQRASRAQRAEALRFLLHFVGDAHQPLHAGHSHDKGGNDINELRLLEYTPAKERTNLHAAWDGGLIAITMAREGWTWQRYAVELDARISDEMIARWGRGSAYDWVEESRLFAAANGYLRADAMTPVRPGDALGEDWYQRNLPVAEQRLQQGGVRLALVLEELF
ncbi:Endonuclease [Enhygromyxa salina]|uniref:Endonuclease n=1 Tax=Enhygromyxa salina TaxID=215803 RepID=A0A0C2DI33_9BACT|nr:Endonuclease [Enhygromyxa salina]